MGTITNLFLKLRYRLFKRRVKIKTFSDRELVFQDDLKNLDNFTVSEGFYNEHPIWFSKDAFEFTKEGLVIKCYRDKASHTNWNNETRETEWTTGILSTRDKFTHSMGVWEIEAKVPDSWPAIWLLKIDRTEAGYTRNQITPEVDIMESMHGKYRHTIHYGYDNLVYRRWEKGSNVSRIDNEFHVFAVEFLANGYNFYIDGVLTATLTSDDPEFVTLAQNYLILNNAAHPYSLGDNYDFIIKSIKVYK